MDKVSKVREGQLMNKKVLLYSGGCDSWLIDKIWKPDVKLYVDIDGNYSKTEISRLPSDVKIIKFPLGVFERDDGFVPLRNLYFLMLASNYGNNICFGAIKGDQGLKDKTEEFIDMASGIINYCLNENSYVDDMKIMIENRFIKMTKYDLLKQYLGMGGSLEEFVKRTFSCHHPIDDAECWNCKPCYRKFLLVKYFGYRFSKDIELKMLDFLKTHVIPRQGFLKGTYFTDRPGEGQYVQKAVDRFFTEYNLNWRDFQ